MAYEVEMKFPVLGALEFPWENPIEEVDTYYAHPCRDFALTDEGLRIRQCNGTSDILTYKGPKIDAETKSREEIEFPLVPGTCDDCRKLLESLGFTPVETVRKFRKSAKRVHENREFHLLLDSVPVLKDRGLPYEFLEIETFADHDTLHEARESLLRFARTLIEQGRLGESVRKGYLEMILESRPTPSSP